ncbi:hypothetical protein FisN_13Hu001 [Fistulifera solaris]|uniref:DEAD/DEAH-box helicase domain-containing protein n=1 Tax=Fistulifera solaris TaxID=1519565 RepID=A0A1Z5KP35_FISSO|nr:hypothetical protein FisN_13Hu001 [Fistulifera solaris]|eukprot:GAX27885.1 hypothetical protein FisN_13Hu001 [Fistulifera solaris]
MDYDKNSDNEPLDPSLLEGLEDLGDKGGSDVGLSDPLMKEGGSKGDDDYSSWSEGGNTESMHRHHKRQRSEDLQIVSAKLRRKIYDLEDARRPAAARLTMGRMHAGPVYSQSSSEDNDFTSQQRSDNESSAEVQGDTNGQMDNDSVNVQEQRAEDTGASRVNVFVSPGGDNGDLDTVMEGEHIMPNKTVKQLFNPFTNFQYDGERYLHCSCGAKISTSPSTQTTHVRESHKGYHLKTKVAEAYYNSIRGDIDPLAIDFEEEEEFVTAPDYSISINALEKYRHKNEKTGPYVRLLQRLIVKCNNNQDDFETFMKCHANFISVPLHIAEEREISFTFFLAEGWIRADHVEYLVEEIVATIRSKILLFKDSENDSSQLPTTFTLLNTNLAKLLEELKFFLMYLWRSGSSRFVTRIERAYKKYLEDGLRNDILLPSILKDYYNDVANGTSEITEVETYCMVRAMKLVGNNLSLKNGSYVASTVSCITKLLRTGLASYLALSTKATFEDKLRLASIAQDSYLISSLAGFTRRLRTMVNLQGHTGKAWIDASGDIHYENNTYAAYKWKILIPETLSRCTTIFESIFQGDEFKVFLDMKWPIQVQKGDGQTYSFAFTKDEHEFKSEDLQLTTDAAVLEYYLGKLSMYLELAFEAYGCGPGRLAEVHRMEMGDLLYELGTFSYNLIVIKTASATIPDSQRERKVKHTLPMEMARVFLLYREILSRLNEYKNHPAALPSIKNNKHKIGHAAQDLLDLDNTPGALEIRQAFTSFQNVVFHDGQNVDLNCVEKAAEMAGHTANTHFGSYSTRVMGAPLTMVRRLHVALGGAPIKFDTSRLNDGKILGGLRFCVNPDAQYFSPEQKLLLEYAAHESVCVHGNVPCGGGKSMTWNAIIAARRQNCMERKSMLVVSPYKQLNEHHAAVSIDLLSRAGARIEVVSSSDEHTSKALAALIMSDDRPDIVFLSLSAFASLWKYGKSCLKANYLLRIILDEIHTILSEFYREECKALKNLGGLVSANGIPVPVMTLSGTLHRELVCPIYKYMGLDYSKAIMIESDGLMGRLPTGFYFECKKVTDLVQAASEAARRRLQSTPEGSIHIICETKGLLNKIDQELSKDFSTMQADGDTPDDLKREIAKGWFAGKCQVYITTTCALVGNESARCFHVLVVGNIYSPNNAVQAFNRLRERQRRANGSFQILYTNPQIPYFQETDEKNWEKILREGVLDQSVKTYYFKTCSRMSLLEWMQEKNSCAIVRINQIYDLNPGNPCGTCKCCHYVRTGQATSAGTRKTTDINQARATVQAVQVVQAGQAASAGNPRTIDNNQVRRDAERVLDQLVSMCIICGSANCDGEMCAKKYGKCFRCGLNHHSKECTQVTVSDIFARVREKRRVNGCYKCLQAHVYTGGSGRCSCPYKKRLRRVIHDAFETAFTKDSMVSYDRFLGDILADKEKYDQLLASYIDYTPKHRK